VADLVGTTTTPVTPDSFFAFLVTLLREEAVSLREEAAARRGDIRADLGSYADSRIAQAERLRGILGDANRDRFETYLLVLDTNFASDLHDAHQLHALHGHSLSTEAESQLQLVIEILGYIGVARQHLKIRYFQRTLSALSRELLYVGIPALGLLVAAILVLSGESGPTFGSDAYDLLVVSTSTVAFAPLTVFFAYVLRIATITQRTGTVLPFVTKDDTEQ
jgi:hypothetical protein